MSNEIKKLEPKKERIGHMSYCSAHGRYTLIAGTLYKVELKPVKKYKDFTFAVYSGDNIYAWKDK